MKTSTLIRIAGAIESVKGVRARGTVNEVKSALEQAARGCRTKEQAAMAIAREVYGHPFSGDYPETEAAILGSVASI